MIVEKDTGGIRKRRFVERDRFNGRSEPRGKVLDIQKVDDGVIFRIKVQPGADKNEIVGVQGDALKIKINAPPVKGKANKALIDFLAEKLEVRKSEIKILSGHRSKIKKIKVIGQGTRTKENIQDLPAISTPYNRRV